MDSQSPFKKQYDAILAEKKKNPEASYSSLIAKHKASIQGFWIYKRKLEAAKTVPKVAPKTAPRGPQAPKPVDGDVIYIPVPKREIAEMVINKRHQIVIPEDKVFYAMSDVDSKEVKELIGTLLLEESRKKAPEEVGLSGGGSKKGGLLNKGG